MNRLFFLHLLIAGCFFAACNKIDLPEPVQGEPVFKAEFNLDTEEKRLEAGVGFWYMGTGFEQDPQGVYVFTGILEKRNCGQNCKESIAFHFRDVKPNQPGIPDIGQVLHLGNYAFASIDGKKLVWVYDSTQAGYRVTFDASESRFDPAAVSPQFLWEFPDSSTSVGKNVSHDFPSLDPAPEVTLSLFENNGVTCLSTQSRSILPAGLTCKVHIEAWQGDSATTNLIAVPAGKAPFQFAWDAVPLTTQTVTAVSLLTGITHVTVTDKTGCVANAGLQLANAAAAYCSARFTYQVSPFMQVDSQQALVPDPLQLATVVVAYTGEDGTLYRSDLAQQDSNATTFEVLSAEDYDKNEKGEKTKKLRLRFACRLASASGKVLEVKNGLATIAVAFP
jgi:hypothetical protein